MKNKKLPHGIKPMTDCCASCPFRIGEDGKEHDPDVAEAVRQRSLAGASQLCHSTPGGRPHQRPGKKTRLCRGARNFLLQVFHRIGHLDEPTDEAWEAKASNLSR